MIRVIDLNLKKLKGDLYILNFEKSQKSIEIEDQIKTLEIQKSSIIESISLFKLAVYYHTCDKLNIAREELTLIADITTAKYLKLENGKGR